jgi:hypothetical protein
MKQIGFYLFFFFLFLTSNIFGQSVQDTNIRISMFSGHYGVHFPGADMAKRFGISNALGADFTFKSANNWLFGADFSFIFSDNIINGDSYFSGIRNSKGYVIDGNGMFAEAFLYQRGFILNAMVGKQFNILSPNANSGPFIQFGVGFMQHYVRIENPYKAAPQIIDDYAKLYDKLTNGFNTSQFIGYRYLSNNKLYNFYAGFELIQGFTKGRRSYNADELSSINLPRIDLLYGFRIGWVMPLYGKSTRDFYYY